VLRAALAQAEGLGFLYFIGHHVSRVDDRVSSSQQFQKKAMLWFGVIFQRLTSHRPIGLREKIGRGCSHR